MRDFSQNSFLNGWADKPSDALGGRRDFNNIRVHNQPQRGFLPSRGLSNPIGINASAVISRDHMIPGRIFHTVKTDLAVFRFDAFAEHRVRRLEFRGRAHPGAVLRQRPPALFRHIAPGLDPDEFRRRLQRIARSVFRRPKTFIKRLIVFAPRHGVYPVHLCALNRFPVTNIGFIFWRYRHPLHLKLRVRALDLRDGDTAAGRPGYAAHVRVRRVGSDFNPVNGLGRVFADIDKRAGSHDAISDKTPQFSVLESYRNLVKVRARGRDPRGHAFIPHTDPSRFDEPGNRRAGQRLRP